MSFPIENLEELPLPRKSYCGLNRLLESCHMAIVVVALPLQFVDTSRRAEHLAGAHRQELPLGARLAQPELPIPEKKGWRIHLALPHPHGRLQWD